MTSPAPAPGSQQDELIAELRELHRPFGIYDECDHPADEHTGTIITNCGDFETCLDPMYSICAHCCRDADGEQTEDCVSNHGHGRQQPICETAAILAKAVRREHA